MKTSAFALVSLSLWSFAALAATPIDETRPLNADGKLSVQNVRGSIRITGTARNDVRITGSIGEGAKGLVVEGDAADLRIRVDYPDSKGWSLFGNGGTGFFGGGEAGDSTLVLEVPAGIELKVGAVSANVEASALSGRRVAIETVSGDVRLGTRSPEVEIDAVSGDLVLELDGGREADLQTVSGDIELRGKLAEKLEVETVSGNADIQLTDSPLRKFSASTVSGDLRIESALADDGRIDIESLSGDVRLRVPAATSAALHIESFSGDIRSDAGTVEEEDAGPGSSLDTRLGGGAASIRIESFSGDVHVQTK